jgi:transcriptional regulator with XRE-family HTH domain
VPGALHAALHARGREAQATRRVDLCQAFELDAGQRGLILRRELFEQRLQTARELADLSLKYVGEIERGEANSTLEALERLARAVDWDPMEALEGVREPISEGVRVLLIAEVQQVLGRFNTVLLWLETLNPAIHPAARETPETPQRKRARLRGLDTTHRTPSANPRPA